MIGAALAFGLFAVVLAAPGYLAATGFDLLGFRRRGADARVAISIAVSVAVVPATTYLAARFVSAAAPPALLVGAAVSAAAIAAVRREPLPTRVAVLAAVAWAAAGILLLVDYQFGERVYPGVFAFDYAKHVSVTDAISRTGVPPANPSFFPGAPVGLYYYYFWFLLCSVVDRLGGGWVDARQAVIGGTVWAGLALVAVLSLYLRALPSRTGSSTRARLAAAIAILFVGGTDIVGALLHAAWTFRRGDFFLYPSVEWWNEQVASWPNAVLWVPHHVAGLVAGLTCLLLLSEPGSGRARVGAVVVSALGIASLAGLSIWMAVAVAAAGALLVARWAIVRRWSAMMGALAAGALGALLALPYLLELRAASRLGGSPIAIGVRPFVPLDSWLAARDAGGAATQLLRLLALPLNYSLELGFLALAGLFYWRRLRRGRRAGEIDALVLVLLASGLLVGGFLQSAVRSNDLGWRSVMLAQFALLLWAADVVAPLAARRLVAGRAWVRAGVVLALLGVLSVGYDLAMMRLYPMRNDLSGLLRGAHDPDGVGRRIHDVREAYAWVERSFPADAVLQPNPAVPEDVVFGNGRRVDVLQGLYADRQAAAADPEFGTLYGIPLPVYDAVAAPIASLFAGELPPDRAAALCQRLGIDALLVKDTDPIWPLTDRPLFENAHARVVACP